MLFNRSFKLRPMFASLIVVLVVATVLTATVLAASEDTVNVRRFSDASPVDGSSSTLVRDDDAITVVVDTSELDAGSVYTLWWVVFNNPENCMHGIPGLSQCGEADLLPFGGAPEVNSSALWADGSVASADGEGYFSGYLKEGEASGEVLFGSGLIDASKAEVHVVVRSHGKPIPAFLWEQLNTFEGGCGARKCIDPQFAVHVAP